MKQIVEILFIFCFIAFTVAQNDAEWQSFKNKYKKNYNSTEDARRKGLWMKNYQKIKTHNGNADKGTVKFRLAPNQFLDRTAEEYKAVLGATVSKRATTTKATTTKPTTTTKATITTTKPTTTTAKATTTTAKPAPPSGIDLRNASCTAPIKDQGYCGSCWAFSATYETEYYNCKKKGSLTLLSEQNLVDCDTYDGGCKGGFYDSAWQYTIDASGQCASTAYGYTATGGTCKRSSCSAAGTLTSYQYLANEVDIINTLATVGPVSVAIDAGPDSFSFYSSGVYDEPLCTTKINHAVNIVGYGTATDGTPYWIIRNSWSPDWGMNGYMFMKRGVNMCAVESYAAYPVA